MSVHAGHGKLSDAIEAIRSRWRETEETWRDLMRVEFEEKLWIPLEQESAEMLRAIDRLAQLLTTMRRECRGDRPQ